MPTLIKKTSGDTAYGSPFIGRVDNVLHVKVDVSALTSREVDADGYLKPGVPLALDGTLLGASNTKRVAMVVEATKIADNNTGLSSITNDPFVACATIATVNRDIIEDNLGGVLTADEIAALNGAASSIVLSLT